MDRQQLLSRIQKATLTTADVTAGMLPPEVARQFIVRIKEQTALSSLITVDIRGTDTGFVDNTSTASRIIRKATENSDDGYRVGANFGSTEYQTVKVRLPWEVTEDVFHGNIEGEGFEATLTGEMEKQFALDLEDLEVNGDSASADPFVQINDGILKTITGAFGSQIVDGSTVGGGHIVFQHFFTALEAMPNRYRNALAGRLRWLMSPNTHLWWWQSLAAASGINVAAIIQSEQGPANAPLAIPIVDVPSMPDGVILLVDPKNIHRVVSWEVRKRRLTGETDAQLAAVDKRFYVFFLKHDVIIEDPVPIVRVNGVTA